MNTIRVILNPGDRLYVTATDNLRHNTPATINGKKIIRSRCFRGPAETLDALMSWWGGVLRDGELRLQGEPPIPWRDEWPTSLLFRAYMDAARSDTDLPPVSPVLFGRLLAYVEGRQVRLPEAFPGHRPYGYRFGRVERARKSLQRVTDAQKP